jgi:hypothetical protein
MVKLSMKKGRVPDKYVGRNKSRDLEMNVRGSGRLMGI